MNLALYDDSRIEIAREFSGWKVRAPGAKLLWLTIVTCHCSGIQESHSWQVQGCGPIESLGFGVSGSVDIRPIVNAVTSSPFQ